MHQDGLNRAGGFARYWPDVQPRYGSPEEAEIERDWRVDGRNPGLLRLEGVVHHSNSFRAAMLDRIHSAAGFASSNS